MRISESKCFSWHGLCLLLQGITRSLGGTDMLRVELPTGHARMASGTSSDQHNRRALRAATLRARAARSSPSHLQKARWHFQARKKGEIPTLQGKQEPGSPTCESGVRGRKNAFEFEFSYLTHCWRWFSFKARLFLSGLHSCKVGH